MATLPTNYWSQIEDARIGWNSEQSFDSIINNYDLSSIPDWDNITEPYIGHIIMTRPSLFLTDKNLSVMKMSPMTAGMLTDQRALSLFKQLGGQQIGKHFLPIITRRAKNYNVNDIEIKTVEKGGTFYGHKVIYGKHSEDHKVSGTMSIDFRNDRFLSVFKMMYLWMCYIYMVSKTSSLEISQFYEDNAILDYAGAIYYLVTRRDGRELVYWEKRVGVFPTKVPTSMFSTNSDFIMQDTVSIDFSYGIVSDPCDPAVLIDINALHGSTSKSDISNITRGAKYIPIEPYEAPFVRGPLLATKPYIVVKKDSAGSYKHYLYWTNK